MPLQLGVGIRGGCEALVHAAWALLDTESEGLHLVQIDFVNAFNLGDRSQAYEELQRHFPELSHMVANI